MKIWKRVWNGTFNMRYLDNAELFQLRYVILNHLDLAQDAKYRYPTLLSLTT